MENFENIMKNESEEILPVGTLVEKPLGYRFDGTVVSVFWTLEKKLRYVVQNGDGILHIFSPNQICERKI